MDHLQRTAAHRQLHALSISCCDGIGAASLMWTDLPVAATHVTAEIDELALAVTGHRTPQAMALGDLATITKSTIISLLHRHQPDFCFVSAGTPCKQLSRAAVDSSGLEGKDSKLFWAFRDVLAFATSAAHEFGCPCFWLWENVVMQDQWLSQAEAALGMEAVFLDAACFGHHRRRRVWIFNWPIQDETAKWLRPTPCGRQEVFLPFSARRLPDLGRIFRSSFFPRCLRSAGTRDFPEGKFECLTCPLRPGMVPWGLRSATGRATERARAEGFVYQPYHYEDAVLLWAGHNYRRPNAAEWEELFGFPRAWTDVPGLPDKPHDRELARLRLLGNAWHVPCARLLLLSLLAFLHVPVEAIPLDRIFVQSVGVEDEQPVHDLFGKTGADFVHGYLHAVPAPLGPLALQFANLFAPPSDCEFLAWAQREGCYLPGLYLPTLQEHARPGVNATATARQPGIHLAQHGFPRVVPLGLTPQEHLEQASALEVHPLDTHHDLPIELEWAVQVFHGNPARIIAFRKAQLKWISGVAKRFRSLNAQIVHGMSSRVRAIAGEVNIGLVLFLSIWAAWPDVTYAARLVTGFRIAGNIESPPIFRQRPVSTPTIPYEDNMAKARSYVDKLESSVHSRRHAQADEAVHRLVLKDLAKGFMRPGFPRKHMDSKYGMGMWLPLIRFALEQGLDENLDPKFRAIDNGAAAFTNDMSKTEVRVHTTSVDTVASICKRLWAVWHSHLSGDYPQAKIEAGVEDEASAFRFKPTSEDDAHLLIVAAYDPRVGEMRYHEMLGHPFGIGPAVTNYNRGAELSIHCTRLLFRVPCIHFYDDALMAGFDFEKGWGQYCYQQLQSLLGTALDSAKSQKMAPAFNYIGVAFVLHQLLSHGVLVLLPKAGRLESILEMAQNIWWEKRLSSSLASSLMGKLNFLSSHVAGNIIRGCMRSFAKRAHEKSCTFLTPELTEALEFAMLLLQTFHPRRVVFSTMPRKSVLYWTDAMWEPPLSPGIGMALLAPGHQLIVRHAVVPNRLLAQLLVRKQQIGVTEALACLLGPHCFPELFRGQNVIHFVDNIGVLAGCISGSSSSPDTNAILQLHSLKLAELDCRYWAEYVESAANLADEPSRSTVCPLAASMGADVGPCQLPDIEDLWSASREQLERLGFMRTE